MRSKKKANSTKHGAFAGEPILWGESSEEYESLHRDLEVEWAPNGKTEKFAVEALAKLLWRRRRVERYWQTKMVDAGDALASQNAQNGWMTILRDMSVFFEEAKTGEDVEAVLNKIAPGYSQLIREVWPPDDENNLTNWGAKITRGLENVTPPAKIIGSDHFMKIFDPAASEAELDTLERIDASIDRAIKRLVQIKSVKQILPVTITLQANATKSIGNENTAATVPAEDGRKISEQP